MVKLHTAFRNNHNFFVAFKLYRRRLPFIYLEYTLILWSVISTCGTGVQLHCSKEIILTSPKYPSNYPNDVFKEWHVTAPSNTRILVTFNDFSLEDPDDAILFQDMVNSLNRRRYTGENMQFPPFLTQGHSIRVRFDSSDAGRKRGFNISVSCYEVSSDILTRLVDGASAAEGFLELSSKSGEWRRVCEDSLPATVAEVICGELGYNGVRELTYVNETCLPDDLIKNCTRAPNVCDENTYRLADCAPQSLKCSSTMAVKLKCYEPGYKGCYEFERMQLQNGLPFISTAQCISSCRRDEIQNIAVMNNTECFCLKNENVTLEDLSKCTTTAGSDKEATRTTVTQMYVYNASIGFCDTLNDTVGGSWDSTITWFGSTVHLTCMDGSILNGSGTLQCVPGLTPYHPVWNDSLSTCETIEDSTTCTTMTTASIEVGQGGFQRGKVLTAVWVTVSLLVIAVFVFIYCKRRESCKSWKRSSQHRPGQREETQTTHPTSRGRAVTTDSRRSPNGPSTGITARSTNGPPNPSTNDSSTPIFVIPSAEPDNLPQDSRPYGALSTPTSTLPASTSNRPFRLLHKNNLRSDNHYISLNSDPNQHYYASSSDNQRVASTRPGETYLEPFTVNIINHAYEDTTNDQGLSNAMLANLNPYYYASSSDNPRVASTYATCREEEYQEPSAVEMANHAYEHDECSNDQGQSSATFGNRLPGLSMISRPLPHRPSSSNNCTEGPTLPPRKIHKGSMNAPPASATLRQRKSAMINENNNFLLPACSSDFNVIQDLPKKHPTSNKLMRHPQTPLYRTREKDEQQRRDFEHDNLEAPTPITLKGDRQEPFYHCLESNNNNHGSESVNIRFLHDVPISTNSQGNTDMTDSIRMIDNILYTPLPSDFVQRNIAQL